MLKPCLYVVPTTRFNRSRHQAHCIVVDACLFIFESGISNDLSLSLFGMELSIQNNRWKSFWSYTMAVQYRDGGVRSRSTRHYWYGLLPHPTGIVIGNSVTIGSDVTFYQNVRFGGRHGSGSKSAKMPKIGSNVSVYVGAGIVGDIKVWDNSAVGSNSVVLTDIRADMYAVGAPARVLEAHAAQMAAE